MADHAATTRCDKRMEEAMEKLSEGVRSITSSHEFMRYLTFVSSFHNYSFSNTMLIALQRPDATAVAGYRKWQELGRQVAKGERGISILCPIFKKGKRKAEGGEDGEESRRFIGCKIGKVFSAEQTYPLTEEGELPEIPEPVILSGDEETSTELEASLAEAVRAQGLRLSYEASKVSGEANGIYDSDSGEIAVHPGSPTASRARTLAHELSHHLTFELLEGSENLPQGVKETVAEGTAFVFCHHFCLDASAYTFPYIARWAGDEKVLTAALDAIQKVASRLIEAVEEVGEQGYLLPESSVQSL